jgi:DNA-binding transcriptional MerR regulator
MARHTVNGLSIEELERMLQSRRSSVQKLQRQRSKIVRKLDALDDKIRQLGGSAGRGGRSGGGRARNDQSLLEVIESVLKGAGKPMKVGEIANAAQSKGYRSNSANFRGIVNQTLIKDKRFSAPSRGLYQLKK